jgi:hypothetical protein
MAEKQFSQGESRKIGWRFGLRSLLLVMLLIATYFAGWVSHRLFHNRNLNENISAAVRAIDNNNVEVDAVEKHGVILVKGKKEDVETVKPTIGKVHAAVAK